MNAVESYLSMPAPDRAQHLWRYTPWHRIHPSGVPSELPDVVSPALVNLTYLDGSELPDGVKLSTTEFYNNALFDRAIAKFDTLYLSVGGIPAEDIDQNCARSDPDLRKLYSQFLGVFRAHSFFT